MNQTLHRHTPSLTACDSRGLTIRHIAYHRAHPNDPPQPRISRQQHDAAGNVIAAWDPRLHAASLPPNQTSVFSLSGITLFTRNVDSGTRINRCADAGVIKESWDSRGTCWRTEYDALLRPVLLSEQTEQQPTRIIMCLTYAQQSPESVRHNQCGRLIREDDTAGSLSFADYDLRGQPLSETRHFLNNPQSVDWPVDLIDRDRLLEPGSGATTRWQFTPTGESRVQIDAQGNQQRWSHDLSGALSGLSLLTASGKEQPILLDIAYNASGQIRQQTAGNGVINRADYDPADGRLKRLHTLNPKNRNTQLLRYEYDPVGNVVRIEDRALSVGHYVNQRVEPINRYTYDSLSQLITATGREALGATVGPQLPDLELTLGDTSRLLNFTQHYQYDDAGNLTRLRHVGNNGYTRSKLASRSNNRCLPVSQNGLARNPVPESAFDANGNLQALENGQRLFWDGLNRLSRVVSLVREQGQQDDECYFYDAHGTRLRKITTAKAKGTTQLAEVRYLPGLEIHRDGQQRLHVVTLQAGLCHVRHLHWNAGKPSGIDNDQYRYSFDDPMGSSTTEMDQTARLLSHEGYYPYGGSAWWAARSALQARYKTLRYSGKERDASGLYYYGQRYYAPWLQQWINPDPGGTLDGLNLYRMAGNNPVTYGDPDGLQKTPKAFMQMVADDQRRSRLKHAEQARQEHALHTARATREQQLQPLRDAVAVHREVLSISRQRAGIAHQQLLNHTSRAEHLTSAVKRTGTLVASSAISTGAAAGGAALGTLVCPGIGTVVGAASGFIAGKAASLVTDFAAEKTGLSASIKLKTSALSADKIFEEGEHKTVNLSGYAAAKVKKMLPVSQKGAYKLGKEISKTALGKAPMGPALKLLPEIPELVHENVGAAAGLTPDKTERLDEQITGLIQRIDDNMASLSAMFDELEVDGISTPEIGNVKKSSTAQSLLAETTAVNARLKETQALGRQLAARH